MAVRAPGVQSRLKEVILPANQVLTSEIRPEGQPTLVEGEQTAFLAFQGLGSCPVTPASAPAFVHASSPEISP